MNYSQSVPEPVQNRALIFLINSTALSVFIAVILTMLYFGIDMFIEQSTNYNPDDYHLVFIKALIIVAAFGGLLRLSFRRKRGA